MESEIVVSTIESSIVYAIVAFSLPQESLLIICFPQISSSVFLFPVERILL